MTHAHHHAIDPLDTMVRCRTCGEAQRVDFEECLAIGWPVCCGETMQLVAAGESRPRHESGIWSARRLRELLG